MKGFYIVDLALMTIGAIVDVAALEILRLRVAHARATSFSSLTAFI